MCINDKTNFCYRTQADGKTYRRFRIGNRRAEVSAECMGVERRFLRSAWASTQFSGIATEYSFARVVHFNIVFAHDLGVLGADLGILGARQEEGSQV